MLSQLPRIRPFEDDHLRSWTRSLTLAQSSQPIGNALGEENPICRVEFCETPYATRGSQVLPTGISSMNPTHDGHVVLYGKTK